MNNSISLRKLNLVPRQFLLIFSLSLIPLTNLNSQSFLQREIKVTPVNYILDIKIDYKNERLHGRCQLTVESTTEQPVQKIPLILYRLMKVKSIADEAGRRIPFSQQVISYDDWEALQVNYIEVSLEKPLVKNEQKKIIIEYEGKLLGYTETGMHYVQDRIDAQFTIIREDCRAYPTIGVPSWKINSKTGLPKFNYLINVTVPDSLVVANGGKLIGREAKSGKVTYGYKSIQPSWRIDIPIARYAILEEEQDKIFYFAQDSLQAAKIMKAIKRTLRLYSDWFGPLHNYSGLAVIEIPDGWGSQSDVTSIIQAAAAFKDDNRLFELYHEISHQWNAPKNDPLPPRWEEGLAMFLQYLTIEKLEQRLILDQEAESRINRLKRTFIKNPHYQKIPLIDFGKEGITQLSYTTGMLFFHTLYSLVGEQGFNKIIGTFYQKYLSKGATTDEFVNHVKLNARVDLTKLFLEWFYEPTYSKYIVDGLSMEQIILKYK